MYYDEPRLKLLLCCQRSVAPALGFGCVLRAKCPHFRSLMQVITAQQFSESLNCVSAAKSVSIYACSTAHLLLLCCGGVAL